jgi:predicted sulfurtransferase
MLQLRANETLVGKETTIMKEILPKVLTVLLALASMALFAKAAVAKEVPRMSKEELRGMLGNPDVVIIDVRTDKEWEASQSKIKGAVREEPRQAKSWAHKYDKDKTYVLYCG